MLRLIPLAIERGNHALRQSGRTKVRAPLSIVGDVVLRVFVNRALCIGRFG